MQNPFVQGVGGVLSADIAVPEHENELDFYSSILTTGDTPLWRKDLTSNSGMPVIGLGARTPEYNSLPLQWMPHFQVADVAASAQSAIDLGGTELMHGKTEDGQSQWAVLTDQAGAAFGVIPVVADGADNGQNNEHQGCISWLSLTASDPLSSREFYQQVVGWKSKQATDGNPERFEMLIDDEIAAAEIVRSNDQNDAIPPVWMIHLPVGDFRKSLDRVTENGGSVIRELTESKSAIIRDPVGAYLALQDTN